LNPLKTSLIKLSFPEVSIPCKQTSTEYFPWAYKISCHSPISFRVFFSPFFISFSEASKMSAVGVSRILIALVTLKESRSIFFIRIKIVLLLNIRFINPNFLSSSLNIPGLKREEIIEKVAQLLKEIHTSMEIVKNDSKVDKRFH